MKSNWVIATLLLRFAGNCFAQDDITRKPNFSRVVTNPTGKNGYEELVMATDVIYLRPDWDELFNNSVGDTLLALTLAERRKLLIDPDMQKCLKLVQSGLSKPVTSPHDKIDESTIFPEMSGMRRIARILALKIYVELADGKVSTAIDTLTLGLRLGYVIQTDTLIGGLVGITVDSVLVKRMAQHVPQLSVRDCDQLMQLARDWLNLADPTINILVSEKGVALTAMQKFRNNPSNLVEALGIQEKDPNYKSAKAIAASSPQAAAPIFDDATIQVNQTYEQFLTELKKPAWQRQEIPDMDNKTPAGALAAVFMPSINIASDRFTQDQVQVQLLGVHAAIRKYRWEHESLPNSLVELKLGPLGIDPFNGKPLEYKRIDETHYDLSSIGPLDRNPTDGKKGSRKPSSLPF